MTELAFYIADAFTDQPFDGAQVAVFPAADALSDEKKQILASEINLPLSVFLAPAEGGYKARFFTPHRELPFAAQGLVAAGFVLARLGTQEETWIETKEGKVLLRFLHREGQLERVALTLTAYPIVEAFAPPIEELAAMLGLKTLHFEIKRYYPKIAACGRPFLIVPLKSQQLVRQARFDYSAWAGSAAPMTAAQEILLFSARTQAPEADFHARLVGPDIGPKDDPPIGEAIPAFCAYLASFPELRHGTYAFTVERGSKESRRSLLYLEMDHKGQDRLEMRIGGQAAISGVGHLFV
ncbi:MAG: PhzF family phenazine biosynthesis protein [Methylohalobius sp.]|nr:PhzF family phenazine biosynthesis protein [Methylohalobius sp.]